MFTQLGVMVMIHGDDKGMVMPPRCSPLHVIIVPIIYKDESAPELLERCELLAKDLTKLGVRVKVDDRDNYTPGWKYNEWEVKGVCIRMEIGPRDMKNETARLVRRDTSDKSDHKWDELASVIPAMLEDMHKSMLHKARTKLESSIVKVSGVALKDSHLLFR